LGETPGEREYALTPERYERFLKDLFDVWYRDRMAGKFVYNRYFENLLMILSGQGAETCALQGTCAKQWVVEADGSVYPCDFYALDQWRLGNVKTDRFEDMDARREELGFVAWSERVPEECAACRWYALCRNGCRRNREPVTADSAARNYFCPAYKGFLEYAYPRLTELLHVFRRQTLR
jgi:uncharacterized protein